MKEGPNIFKVGEEGEERGGIEGEGAGSGRGGIRTGGDDRIGG